MYIYDRFDSVFETSVVRPGNSPYRGQERCNAQFHVSQVDEPRQPETHRDAETHRGSKPEPRSPLWLPSGKQT